LVVLFLRGHVASSGVLAWQVKFTLFVISDSAVQFVSTTFCYCTTVGSRNGKFSGQSGGVLGSYSMLN